MTGAGPEPEESVNLPELLGGFRPSRGGGATARFGTVEAANIRYLVGQVVELLGGDTLDEEKPDDRTAGPRDRPSEKTPDAPDDGLPSADDLAAMIGLTENHELPSDPALARLLPDAYSDDPEASGEFRRYTEQGLRSGKVAAARTVLATLPPTGGRVRLSGPEAQAWLRALNDVRLALGVRLEVTEDFDELVARMSPDDPRLAYADMYHWLGYLQETLVGALSR